MIRYDKNTNYHVIQSKMGACLLLRENIRIGEYLFASFTEDL